MLTSAYFEQVHPQFPFLHQPTYLQWEEEVMTACESGYTPNPTKAFFVFAVCFLLLPVVNNPSTNLTSCAQ